MITVEGFSAEQKVLADLMWGIQTLDELKIFLRMISPEYRHKCIVIIEAMRVAVIDHNVDQLKALDQAANVLSKFTSKE